MQVLLKYLNQLPQGQIAQGHEQLVLDLLTKCWAGISGSEDQSTAAYKLARAEELSWSSPILSFKLERHGGTVMGSSRAKVHHWEVDCVAATANIVRSGTRQLEPMSKRLNTKELAQQVANAIVHGEATDKLKWYDVGAHAVVVIGKVIPATNKQTTASRRKRFRADLEEIMKAKGWARKDMRNVIGFLRP